MRCYFLAPGVLALIACWAPLAHGQGGNDKMPVYEIRGPRFFFFGMKPANTMDEVLRRLKPGERARVRLLSFDSPLALNSSLTPKIEKGSVLLHARSGYLRLAADGKVYSNPDGSKEKAIAEIRGQDVQFTSEDLWDRFSLEDLTWRQHALRKYVKNGQSIAEFDVELSDDFEGDFVGWTFTRGK